MTKHNITDQELDKRIAQLTTEMSPEKDLWVGVERAIANKEQHSASPTTAKRHIHLAWAASFVAAILLTWGLTMPSQQVQQTPIDLALMMEENFNTNKQLILASYGQTQGQTLSADMQKQLNELSSARATINNALKADPNNSDLLNLLRWTQQQELDLLQQIYSPQWQTI
ncbi:MAG: hypothetical protein ACPG46_09555 [Thalassotalea sp.]